jgi:hypothetical protein
LDHLQVEAEVPLEEIRLEQMELEDLAEVVMEAKEQVIQEQLTLVVELVEQKQILDLLEVLE